MKTLYNSLKQEYRDRLEASEEEYPATIRAIKKSLYYNELWSCLTISQVRDFMAFANYSLSEVAYEDWAFGAKFLTHED